MIIPGEHVAKCLFSLEAHVTMSRKHLLLFSIGCCRPEVFQLGLASSSAHWRSFFFFCTLIFGLTVIQEHFLKPQLASLYFPFLTVYCIVYTHTRTNTLAHSRMNFQDLDVQGEEKHVLKCQCSEPHHLAQDLQYQLKTEDSVNCEPRGSAVLL